jgi:hypothetical protein
MADRGHIVDEIGVVDPDKPMPKRPRAIDVIAPLPTRFVRNAAPVEQAAAAPDPFAGWPDGRIAGMFDCKPEPVAWLFRDRMPRGRAVAVASLGGVGKTRLQYHMAVGAIIGRLPWGWEVDTTGSAALFLLEDTIDDSHRVLNAMGAALTEEERKLLGRQLRVYQLASYPARLLELSGNALRETKVYDWLMYQLEKMPKPLGYVGIDPAVGTSEGDEMSAAHQRRLGELMDRIAIKTGATLVLTTHAAKSLRLADELDSHSSRGSGAITDAVRAEYVMRSMTADEARRFGIADLVERRRYVQLQAAKGNSLPPEAFAPVWLRRGEAGQLSAATLEQVTRGTVSTRDMQALELLREANDSGETSLRFWQGKCEAAGLLKTGSQSAREKAMQRIRDSLLKAGRIEKGNARGLWTPT